MTRHRLVKAPLWITWAVFVFGLPAIAFAKSPAPNPQESAASQIAPVPAGDADKTLAALHDELARSKERLVLPGQQRPYFIAYRLLDLDERVISAEFGALLTGSTTR